jgi:hypothetical protein
MCIMDTMQRAFIISPGVVSLYLEWVRVVHLPSRQCYEISQKILYEATILCQVEKNEG